MTRQYRQGDVLLCAVDRIPPSALPVPSEDGRVVVAFGELTEHAHAFAAEAAQLFREEESGRAFIVIAEGDAELVHEDHDPILVPHGRYELRRQREYIPRLGRFVAD